MSGNWPENSPDSLEDICLEFCVRNLDTFTEQGEDGLLRLKPDISFQHPGLCDKLFTVLSTVYKSDLSWLGIFNDTSSSRLTQVILRHRKDLKPSKHLRFLSAQPITVIDLTDCDSQSDDIPIYTLINRTSKTLKSLRFEECDHFTHKLQNFYDFVGERGEKDALFKCSLLQRLAVNCDMDHFKHLFGPLPNLTHLDFSDAGRGIIDLSLLQNFPNLLSLNLSSLFMKNSLEELQLICKAKKLRHLDISTPDVSCYTDCENCLRYIIENLPDLRSLDISGTNLAGVENDAISHRPTAKGDTEIESFTRCSIPGLEKAKLEFLGLLDCTDEPCTRKNIPATRVTGNHNEEQILLSLKCYIDKKYALMSAMNHLFTLFRYETVKDHCQSLESILVGMRHNPEDKQIQISGSASLFYIVKGEHKEKITPKQKKRLVECLLDAMETHYTDQTMLRNSCLTICNLNLPNDVAFCHRRLVQILLEILKMGNQEEFILRISIYLLNCLACQVDGEEKRTFGDLGAVDVMLSLIRRKLNLRVCDDVMEVAWSTLWNVTDETAPNCERFIDGEGLQLFRQCLETFPTKNELLRNMMGLMGNIAEVQHLRRRLMNSEFIKIFSTLLESTSDGIEVSYNACGIFSHITADGLDAWTIHEPTREATMDRMIAAIRRWPLSSQRNINYRSFLPILAIVKAYDTVAAQYWAVWALCNLTSVYPDKYSDLLKREGGIEILKEVISDPRPLEDIKKLARAIVTLLEEGPGAVIDIPMGGAPPAPPVNHDSEDEGSSSSDEIDDEFYL